MALTMPPQPATQTEAAQAEVLAQRQARVDRALARENQIRAQAGQAPLSLDPIVAAPAIPAAEPPVEPVVPAQQPEPVAPVAEPAPAEAVLPAHQEAVATDPGTMQTADDVKTIDLADEGAAKWRREAETFREKNRKLEGVARQLAPLRQEAAVAKQELQAKDGEIASLKSEIAEIKQLLQGTIHKPQAPTPEALFDVPVYDPTADRDFAELNPEAAERIKAVSLAQAQAIQRLNQTYEQKIAALESQFNGDRQSQHQAYVADHQQRWDNQFRQLVPNVHEYIGDSPKAQAFRSWLSSGFTGYSDAVRDPYSHAPHDIAFIIREFDRQAAPTRATREPSIAEIANPALTGRAAPVIQEQAPTNEFLTDAEMGSIERTLRNLRHQGKNDEANALRDKYQKTLAHNLGRR